MKKLVLLLALFLSFAASVSARPSNQLIYKLNKLQHQYGLYNNDYNSICNACSAERGAVDKDFYIAKGLLSNPNISKRRLGQSKMDQALNRARNFYGNNGLLLRRVNLCQAWENIGREIDNLYKNRRNELNGQPIWEYKANKAKKYAIDRRTSFATWYERQFSAVYRKQIQIR